MKIIVKRSISAVMAFVMTVGLIFSINLSVSGATVDYVYEKGYIKNWGVREQVATFLSQNAEAFYRDNGTSYQALSSLAGSSNVNSVPSSALYKKLQTLMSSNHSKQTSYGETRYLFPYTDCQNSGKTSNAISSFYSGVSIGPDWDQGITWNREHSWPKSKTAYKSVQNSSINEATDIMTLRPTASSENSSRGNDAYGIGGSYFNPNTFAGGNYDLRGDCARIALYVYVRWGNTSYMWGSGGMIQGLDVLLQWMEEDPVDTWELGRNDSVESITGTRNVFVDYPELGFLLFGTSVPANYASPSGGKSTTTPPAGGGTTTPPAGGGTTTTPPSTDCQHKNTVDIEAEAPRCDLDGYTAGKYCSDCQTYITERTIVPATGHKYTGEDDTVCDICGAVRELQNSAPNNDGNKTNDKPQWWIVLVLTGGAAVIGSSVGVIVFSKKRKR